MNHQIQKLIKQVANSYEDSTGIYPEYHKLPDGFLDQVTELIVKKCGEISQFGNTHYSPQHNIHKYFGIDE